MPRKGRIRGHPLTRVVEAVAVLGVLIGLGVALRALTAGLGGWDGRVSVEVAAWRGPFAIDVAHVLSVLGRSWLLLPLAALTGWSLRGGGLAWVPVCSVVAADITQNVVKLIVRRPRPHVPHLEHVSSWSFPSGHAAESAAFLAAAVLASWPLLGGGRRRGAAIVLAAAIALGVAGARIVLGVHYPTDAAAGVVLGVTAAGLSRICLRRRR